MMNGGIKNASWGPRFGGSYEPRYVQRWIKEDAELNDIQQCQTLTFSVATIITLLALGSLVLLHSYGSPFEGCQEGLNVTATFSTYIVALTGVIALLIQLFRCAVTSDGELIAIKEEPVPQRSAESAAAEPEGFGQFKVIRWPIDIQCQNAKTFLIVTFILTSCITLFAGGILGVSHLGGFPLEGAEAIMTDIVTYCVYVVAAQGAALALILLFRFAVTGGERVERCRWSCSEVKDNSRSAEEGIKKVLPPAEEKYPT